MAKKSTIGLILLAIGLLVLNIFQFYYFNYMRMSISSEDLPIQIMDLKGLNWQNYIGRRVTVEGFFAQIRSNLFLLVSNLDYLEINSQIPNDRFIRISGNLSQGLQEYSGARVYIKGTVEHAKEVPEELLQMAYISHKIVEQAKHRWHEDIVSIGVQPGIRLVEDYAVLISGGIDSSHAYYRYWNDLKYMYSILVNRYNYDTEHIYVIYKTGVAEDSEMPVNYSATFSNVQTVFNDLDGKMGTNDNLFVYTTNHGGSTGLCLYYNQQVTPSQMATMLNALSYNQLIVVMEQCFSGNFISQICGANRVIITACSASESSWSCDSEGSYDEFVYHFMSAVNFQTPGGVAVNADTNSNERVSMIEAFNYASSHDSRSESPHYDDNADGVGHMASLPSGGDGTLGSHVYL